MLPFTALMLLTWQQQEHPAGEITLQSVKVIREMSLTQE